MSNSEMEPELLGSVRSRRAGLVFPVTRFHRLLRKHLIGRRISLKASVYCAAVLEYLIAEVLEVSGNCSKDVGKRRIEPRHVYVAVRCDADLNEITAHATFRGGGMIPSARQ
ncbi:core histone H2A/H2B/H3/H4 [Ancylostoma caninum]|uniref:Histone H2A n=1 Tax=Ancylostoma caninum TaxID=29170 RepID=A0A368H7P1_ANCCA|nr:core histone H2A/H2B/H3/H4 [Ancylostoma caninum]